MKKKLKILVYLVAALSIACSKDDVDNPTPEVIDVSGIWNLTDYHFEGSRRIIDDLNVTTINFNASAWDIDVVADFSDENSYHVSGIYNLDITIIDEDGSIYYYPRTDIINESGTWSRNNDYLGITVDDVLRQASIILLNDTTLNFVISSNTNETDENNHNVSIFRTDYYTYTRPAN